MPKVARPDDVLKLGEQVATLKANMPASRWKKFVKTAHARGYTVGGALSGNPDSLKERTASSLRDEAQKTVATAYAPAQQELSTRQAAIGNLDAKRKSDDASYRQWLVGETTKINAQARAADTTLATQQSDIARETKDAITASRADSLKRMTETGGVSDPTQSTALDTSAADAASTAHIGAAREQTAAITKIGEDSRTLASAAVLGQQAAREAARQGDTWKALADVATESAKLKTDQAGATLDLSTKMIADNATAQASNREADLAADSLGVKKLDLAQQVTEANRKYKLENAKFGLDKWKAENADKVAQAKLDLGYAGIKAREGTAAANRKLNEKLAKIRATATTDAAKIRAAAQAKDKKKGITQPERDLYRTVSTVQSLFVRWSKNNAVPAAEREQHLRDMGYDDATIQVARELANNNGVLPESLRATARRLGITHSGYFWPVAPAPPSPAGDRPQTH